jgi:NitT/TauT family transport system substrate-binding protein
MANPTAGIETVKARDGIINVALETRRLQLAIELGGGQPRCPTRRLRTGQSRPLALMASQVSDAYGTKTRINPTAVWNGSFLPTAAELNVLPPAR